jgi:phospholipid/cholesterol/gamma-HCH transport system permease protein
MGAIRNGLESTGDMIAFGARLYKGIFGGRVLKFSGEVLRQAGILIIGSVAIIMMLVFILGLQCGIEGAYASRTIGSPSVAGAFTALCDLREVTPYAFGYMMAAKVGTGFVAELGSMRISDEIDALEVLGLDSLIYLCATRLLGMWLVLPFVYIAAIAFGFVGSYIAVVRQIGEVSPGGYLEIFWQFQNPVDLIFSAAKGMTMATFIVIVACYYGYTAGGGPVGVGKATAQSMVVNILGIHAIGMLGTQLFWGGNPRAPIGG